MQLKGQIMVEISLLPVEYAWQADCLSPQRSRERVYCTQLRHQNLFLLQIFPFTLFGFITAGRQGHAFSIDVSGCQKIQAGTSMIHIHQGLIQMLDVDAVKLDYSKKPKFLTSN